MKQQNRVSQFAKNCLKVTALLVWGAAGLVWGKLPTFVGDITEIPAPDGEVIFEGEIEQATCQIESESRDLTITLPTISPKLLKKLGDTAGQKPFSIQLIGCQSTVYDLVELSWRGVGIYPGTLLNTVTENPAQNVLIQVIKPDDPDWMLSGAVTDKKKAKDSGINNVQPRFDYIAQYFATGQAGTGNVSANATFKISYH